MPDGDMSLHLEAQTPFREKPGPEHHRLEAFAGRWRLEGRNLEGAPVGAGEPVSGEGTFEWQPGGFFLSGMETNGSGEAQHITRSTFGHTKESGYLLWMFDNFGYARVYQGRADGKVWTFTGPFERAQLEEAEDGRSIRHYWEVNADGKGWKPLCEFTQTRVD